MEKEILTRVDEVWNEICPNEVKPTTMVWLKVQGKNTPNGCIVLMILDEDKRYPVALVKIPRTPDYTRQIELECDSINSINKRITDNETKAHVPTGAVLTTVAGKKVLIEGACDGHPMVREFLDDNAIKSMSQTMSNWQIAFSKSSMSEDVEFTPEIIEQHVSSILSRLKEESLDSFNMLSSGSKEYFEYLGSRLEGKKIKLVQQHGDFSAYNILVQMRGIHLSDYSVIDWEDYSIALPIFDLNHFFIINSNLVTLSGSATEKYKKYILASSWYRDMYLNAVDEYTNALSIDKQVYWSLSPLYFVEMANRALSSGRQQGETVQQWIAWCNDFIEDISNFTA